MLSPLSLPPTLAHPDELARGEAHDPQPLLSRFTSGFALLEEPKN
ncbi:hypothetical protein [Nannocystis pusilla]